MSRRKKAVVVARDHVIAIRLKHPRVRPRLRKNFPQHPEINAQCLAQPETFGERGGIGIHDHIDESFDVRGVTYRADVFQR